MEDNKEFIKKIVINCNLFFIYDTIHIGGNMKIGIALSGGGVRGAAHIGVIRALEENNIPIDAIGGTSSGSMVASLYSMGYNPNEILKLFNYFSKTIFQKGVIYNVPEGNNTLSVNMGGLVSGENISFAIKESARYKNISRFSDIKMPIVIPTVDINEGKKYVFTNSEKNKEYYIKDAPIELAVRASASYPGMFASCLYKNHKFVDGGIIDNIPVDEVKDLGVDKVIAVKFSIDNDAKTRGMTSTIFKAIDLIFDERAKSEVKNADYVINIDTKGINIFNIKGINKIYESAYLQTLEQIEKIKKKIN